MTVQLLQSGDRKLECRLRGEMRNLESRLRAEIRDLDERLYKAEADAMRAKLLRWIIGTWTVAALAIGGMITTLGVAVLRALPHS